MAISHMQAWGMGAFGSLLGGIVVAYYLGDDDIRDRIIFITPFLILGTIGTFKALSYIEPE